MDISFQGPCFVVCVLNNSIGLCQVTKAAVQVLLLYTWLLIRLLSLIHALIWGLNIYRLLNHWSVALHPCGWSVCWPSFFEEQNSSHILVPACFLPLGFYSSGCLFSWLCPLSFSVWLIIIIHPKACEPLLCVIGFHRDEKGLPQTFLWSFHLLP